MNAGIRPFRAGDEDDVLAVVFAAFSSPGRDGSEEVDIVERTWRCTASDSRLELVATEGETIVGHLAAAPGLVDGRATGVAGVAPVCVAAGHQGRGAGSALVRELIARAHARAWPGLVLLGDPGFYGRFGFGPAGPHGLHYAPVGRDDPHFMARPLADDGLPRGVFSYCWET
jgi:putative acetyltransferase